ncbi:MAG: peptidase [Alphaproteobacteria bacterium]
MTYCAALKLDDGIVFGADTRTNAGVDNIACFRKLHRWVEPGERVIVLLTAGNLSVTQSVVTLLDEQVARGRQEGSESLLSAPNMFHAARLVGAALRSVRDVDGPSLEASNAPFAASLLLGGQIHGEPPRLFNLYAEGNFIEAGADTSFFQIGEHKYGKPILDRVARPSMSLPDATKLLLLSFDSTLRSNLSVGLPLDILLYRTGTFRVSLERRIDREDAYFQSLSQSWSSSLREAFARIAGLDPGDPVSG